jgi:hypothetical protein
MRSNFTEPLLFLDIESSSPDEDGYPICIAWSTVEGEIQTALIIPEDDWVDWDFSYQHSHGLTREHLFQQGQTALDVIKQLTADLADYTVYVDGLDFDHEWMDRLFTSFNMTIPFELEYFSASPFGFRYEHFSTDREELLQDHGLSGFNAENNVYIMLKIAERQQALE